jgi:hypothetical protein
MARPDDEDTPWTRQLLVVVGVLAAVALVIGGVMSVVALGAAKVSGIDDTEAQASEPARLVMPSGEPTTRPEPYPDPQVKHSTAPSASASAQPPGPKPRKKNRTISLQAFPHRVSANQRINLTGTYAGGEGARLQVQRYEGSWQTFPVTASVSGGLFNTYVYTSHTGPQKFRVLDTGTGKKSNAVSVTVG